MKTDFENPPPLAHWLGLSILWLIIAGAVIYGCQPAHAAVGNHIFYRL